MHHSDIVRIIFRKVEDRISHNLNRNKLDSFSLLCTNVREIHGEHVSYSTFKSGNL